MIGEALKGHLELLLLAILEKGPAHGYAIIESLRVRSSGTFDLPEGTIYPALHRLESDGLLSSEWINTKGRARRVYRITPRGQLALVKCQQEWHQFANAVEATINI